MEEPLITMSVESESQATTPRFSDSTFVKLARYVLVRLTILTFTVAIGIYIKILIANMGGYVDEIRRGAIRE